jgi:hypothetical protein
LLPFFEWYNWGCECCTLAIMTYSHSIQDIQQISKWPKTLKKLHPSSRRLLICNFFHKNTSHSHDNLRRVSKSPLLHPFTHGRSGTLD